MKQKKSLFSLALAFLVWSLSVPSIAWAQTAVCDPSQLDSSRYSIVNDAGTALGPNDRLQVGKQYTAKASFAGNANCITKGAVVTIKAYRDSAVVKTCSITLSATQQDAACIFAADKSGAYEVQLGTNTAGVFTPQRWSSAALSVSSSLPTPSGGGLPTPSGGNDLPTPSVNATITPTPSGANAGVVATIQNPIPYDSIGELIVAAIRFILTMLGAVTVFFIVWGSVKMVISQGNESAIKNAKATIQWAVIGLVVALMSFSVIALVQSFLRRDTAINTTNTVTAASSLPVPSSAVRETTATTPTPRPSTTPTSASASAVPGVVPWSGRDPYPAVDWSNTKPELRTAVEAFNKAWGSTLSVRQAYRPADYTAHIRSVWEAWQIVNGKSHTPGYGCAGYSHVSPAALSTISAAQKEVLRVEAQRHGFLTGDTPPACQSDHSLGFAVDITPPANSGSEYKRWIQVAHSVGLCHYIAGDEPHFGLTAYLPKNTNCQVE